MDGEDFAALAEEYSDDTGSAVNVATWAGLDAAMVPAFEEAASLWRRTRSASRLPRTTVTTSSRCWRKTTNVRKRKVLEQQRAQAFDDWLREQVAVGKHHPAG